MSCEKTFIIMAPPHSSLTQHLSCQNDNHPSCQHDNHHVNTSISPCQHDIRDVIRYSWDRRGSKRQLNT
eukprot:793879-Amorphochlora_amoeboformis.AAC.1